MEKTLWKLAFGRFAWVIFTEMKGKWVVPTFPIGPVLAGDGTVPDHEVHGPVGQRLRPRHETVGVILAPGLALLGEAAARDPSRHGGWWRLAAPFTALD